MDWDAIKKLDFERIHSIVMEGKADALFEAWLRSRHLSDWADYLKANPPSPEVLAIALALGREKYLSAKGRENANKGHAKPGRSREKRGRIREIWASGKYSSRDECAEKECNNLGMSFSAARKALRNTPPPPSRCTA